MSRHRYATPAPPTTVLPRLQRHSRHSDIPTLRAQRLLITRILTRLSYPHMRAAATFYGPGLPAAGPVAQSECAAGGHYAYAYPWAGGGRRGRRGP